MSAGNVTIDRVVTSGTFSLDGGTWDVDNNVWIIGDDSECIVIDPAHNPEAIRQAVGERTVKAILLTHGHDDHISSAGAFWELVKAPIHLHQDDWMLWRTVFPEIDPDVAIMDGDEFTVAGSTLKALHTPGHSPGSVSFHLASEATLFSGDTLFQGGPGATGRSYSDFPTIIDSIRTRLFPLPEATVVRTGHGDSTTIGAEKPHLDEWIARGH
ncbi:Glyoxylase, beta-lactamase superfamily II [Arthrobacter sp. yr096]|uniref:MBL fold metallo-hydrolase n=1 Tax=unclassified Arthrobacter TaxID=235627 RepID=UPI0008987DAD|nr:MULTISPECIES: MBL fold metallo-hydrolase [unclassified Arthrobacter]SDW48356.1 Glyoxylase, beta-lactamase superfamily II [Arthrobacter sp. cf158]SEJ69230.1 Glyoxylase, beta-lactamase superfamily II [Arthrobacter sp. yr096]